MGRNWVLFGIVGQQCGRRPNRRACCSMGVA